MKAWVRIEHYREGEGKIIGKMDILVNRGTVDEETAKEIAKLYIEHYEIRVRDGWEEILYDILKKPFMEKGEYIEERRVPGYIFIIGRYEADVEVE